MRGCAEFEGVHQEAELFLGLFGREAQGAENPGLEVGIMDTDRAATDFGAVADEVVGIGPHPSGIAFEVLHVLRFG